LPLPHKIGDLVPLKGRLEFQQRLTGNCCASCSHFRSEFPASNWCAKSKRPLFDYYFDCFEYVPDEDKIRKIRGTILSLKEEINRRKELEKIGSAPPSS